MLYKQAATLEIAFEEVIGRPKAHDQICKFSQDDSSLQYLKKILQRDDSRKISSVSVRA